MPSVSPPAAGLSGTSAVVTGTSSGFGRAIAAALTAAGADVAGHLIDKLRPRILVLNAGASPLAWPLQQQARASFSRTWDVDVQHVFHWTREALLRPLEPGSEVTALSSGPAVHGSPLSGGYAGAKATIRFTAVLPALTPGGLGPVAR